MDLSVIISISGKPGLYKVMAQSKNGLIVESLLDGKKMPVHASARISALEDISIYTYTEDVPLKDVLQKVFEHEDGKKSISHKESANKLRDKLKEILPDYDEDRVYDSDVKKLFNWYNMLQSKGLIDLEKEEEEETKAAEKKEAKKEEKEEKAESKEKKKPAAKKKETKPKAKKKTKSE